MKAKKSFGQHFLNKEQIAQDIAFALVQKNTYSAIVEVGPGKGMLTKYLMQHKEHQLKVIEADRDMVLYLAKCYPSLVPAIIAEDFLKINLEHVQEGQFALIGNFPYNISSQIVFKMLEFKEKIPEMVGMFQKEVAERIVSVPNRKSYGILSVLVQAFYDVEYLFTIGPENFTPPPRVQSAVIRLTRKKNFKNLGCPENHLRAIVKAAFGMRRKMLRNSMKQFLPKSVIFTEEFFTKRPENLSVQDYVYLTNLVIEHSPT